MLIFTEQIRALSHSLKEKITAKKVTGSKLVKMLEIQLRAITFQTLSSSSLKSPCIRRAMALSTVVRLDMSTVNMKMSTITITHTSIRRILSTVSATVRHLANIT